MWFAARASKIWYMSGKNATEAMLSDYAFDDDDVHQVRLRLLEGFLKSGLSRESALFSSTQRGRVCVS